MLQSSKTILKSRFSWVNAKFGKGRALSISRYAIKEVIVRDDDGDVGTFVPKVTTVERLVSICYARH